VKRSADSNPTGTPLQSAHRGLADGPQAQKGADVMPKIAFPLTLSVVLAASTMAHAAPKCTAEPKDRWMSEQAMKAKLAELGYERIKTFKVSGDCYEIYGYTKEGQKAEVYFNPVTGGVVKANIGG
jgi:hypothetical protein